MAQSGASGDVGGFGVPALQLRGRWTTIPRRGPRDRGGRRHAERGDGDVESSGAIASRSGGYQGIGFAIPSSTFRAVYKALLEDGEVTRGFLGVALQEMNPELQQALAALDMRAWHQRLVSIASSRPPAGRGQSRRRRKLAELLQIEATGFGDAAVEARIARPVLTGV